MLAVLDPEIIDILPVVAQHLPLSGVGSLRATCRLLRYLPCVLATPTRAHDHTEEDQIKLLDSPDSVQFLLSLPRLQIVYLKEPKSLFGLHQLSHLTKVILDCRPGQLVDFRTLRDLRNCRRLELFYVEQTDPSTSPLPCLNEPTQVTSLLLHGADCLTNEVWQLSGLQNLQVLTCSSQQQTYWEQLTALKNLNAPDQALRNGLEHLLLLKCLCISAWTPIILRTFYQPCMGKHRSPFCVWSA